MISSPLVLAIVVENLHLLIGDQAASALKQLQLGPVSDCTAVHALFGETGFIFSAVQFPLRFASAIPFVGTIYYFAVLVP